MQNLHTSIQLKMVNEPPQKFVKSIDPNRNTYNQHQHMVVPSNTNNNIQDGILAEEQDVDEDDTDSNAYKRTQSSRISSNINVPTRDLPHGHEMIYEHDESPRSGNDGIQKDEYIIAADDESPGNTDSRDLEESDDIESSTNNWRVTADILPERKDDEISFGKYDHEIPHQDVYDIGLEYGDQERNTPDSLINIGNEGEEIIIEEDEDDYIATLDPIPN